MELSHVQEHLEILISQITPYFNAFPIGERNFGAFYNNYGTEFVKWWTSSVSEAIDNMEFRTLESKFGNY